MEHKMITESMGLGINAAQHGAQVVTLGVNPTYRGQTKSFSLRLPLHVAVKVQAMSAKSGRNVNATALMLIEIGLEELCRHLSSEVSQELLELESVALAETYSVPTESGEV
jgi:predicted DNA-binding protein